MEEDRYLKVNEAEKPKEEESPVIEKTTVRLFNNESGRGKRSSMSKEEVKTERHTETKEEAIKNMRKIVEVEEENHVETKEEAVKRVAEPLSVTIEKAKKDINTAVIMAERNYGLHSSITVLVLESILANARAGNATVAAMEFEQYKGELLKNE